MPLLLLLLAGSADLAEALSVDRKLNQIASGAADLVAQRDRIDAGELADILAGSKAILAPYDPAGLGIVIAAIDVAGTSQTVAWAVADGSAAPLAGSASPVAVPAKVAETGVQNVVVKVTYRLGTLFTRQLWQHDGYAFTATFFARPRVGNTVTRY